MFVATNYTFVSGKGNDLEYELLSFDKALSSVGIGQYNIVKVSSILPPKSQKEELLKVQKGSILYTAYATKTIFGGGKISSAVSVGIPRNPLEIGVIMEYSSCNDKEYSIDHSKKMVMKAMEMRGIELKDILSIGIEENQIENAYLTTFAGIVLW